VPLTQLQTNLVVSWVLSVSNAPFAPTTQGVDGVDWNVQDLAEIFNEIYVADLAIAGSGSQTLDLTSLTDLTYQAIDFSAILYLVAIPTGSGVIVGPGASNGIDIFGSTNTVTVPQNGALLWSGDPAGTGLAVSGTHKTILFTNTTGEALSLDVVIVGA
jgi:hypothetical protein